MRLLKSHNLGCGLNILTRVDPSQSNICYFDIKKIIFLNFFNQIMFLRVIWIAFKSVNSTRLNQSLSRKKFTIKKY
jgi:hypothetical protein